MRVSGALDAPGSVLLNQERQQAVDAARRIANDVGAESQDAVIVACYLLRMLGLSEHDR